ncbi:MAG: class II aldolase/adducin family protein [Clostridiales bacterium]|jgi:ribulose-5-phosphate 4-epimerase/fuculose-1-phosphate aldolase|nr:class II aldolase/adducin family protein [Clostridiales bacterium]
MSDNSKIQSIIVAATRLAEQNLADNGASIAAKADFASDNERGGSGFFMTAASADFSAMTERHITFASLSNTGDGGAAGLFARAFAAKPKARAAIVASTPYLLRLSELSTELPPILDDFAQIIGGNLKIAVSGKIAAALRGRNGCLLENKGVLVLGRTLDETVTALLVAEKTAKVFVLSHYLGAPAPISAIETKLMSVVYRIKYSKKNQKAMEIKEK